MMEIGCGSEEERVVVLMEFGVGFADDENNAAVAKLKELPRVFPGARAFLTHQTAGNVGCAWRGHSECQGSTPHRNSFI